MRILLADDQADVRSALRLVIEHEGWEVAAECEHLREVRGVLQDECPDLILLDWELPGWQALSADEKRRTLWAMHARCPTLKLLALSVRPEARPEALAAGMDGYASKVDARELLDALGCCAEGR